MPVFERVQTAEEMRPALLKNQWDIVISDYMMPDFNGLAALNIFRKAGLTCRTEDPHCFDLMFRAALNAAPSSVFI